MTTVRQSSVIGIGWTILGIAMLAGLNPNPAICQTCPTTTHTALVALYNRYIGAVSPCALDQDDAVYNALVGQQWSTPVQMYQISLSKPPYYILPYFVAQANGKDAICLSTHGSKPDGWPALEMYPANEETTAFNAATRYANSTQFAAPGSDPTVFYMSIEDASHNVKAWAVGLTDAGISLACHPNADALFDGEYCYSIQSSASWGVDTFVGYDHEVHADTACADQALFWRRVGCVWSPSLDGNVTNAVAGDPGNSQAFPALLGLKIACGGNWIGWCNGCKPLSAIITRTGAFGDTAFCQSQAERGDGTFVLRGYTSSADYPANPTYLDTLPALGGAGRLHLYSAAYQGSFALLDWANVDLAGGVDASYPFVVAARPSDWDSLISVPDIVRDSVEVHSELEPDAVEVSGGLVNEATCADIVVYSSVDSLAEPARIAIAADNPTKRVLKIVSSDALPGTAPTAETCRQRLGRVLSANASWNAYCGTPLQPACNGRYYPVAPGPEVYIIGDYSVVYKGQLDHASTACGGARCASDWITYDIDGDGLPDGPLSRVPAQTVQEVKRAVGFSRDWNIGRLVDPGKDLLLLSGDVSGGRASPWPTRTLAAVASSFALAGLRTLPILKESAYGGCDPASHINALKLEINGGIQEVFGMGLFTAPAQWPGGFLSCDASLYTKKQRVVAWLPGCEMHDGWSGHIYSVGCSDVPQSCVVTRTLMFNDTTRTGLAASVSHMDIGYDRSHDEMAVYLASARSAAANGTVRQSVARTTFDAVTALAADHPDLGDYVLSTSVWGSYTLVPLKSSGSGGGGCPYVDDVVDGAWRPVNTILGRSTGGEFVHDALALGRRLDVHQARYALRVRENEQEQTTLDAIGLLCVDHDSTSRALPSGGGYRLGHVTAATSVIDEAGRDRGALLSGGSASGIGVALGDTLYVAFGSNVSTAPLQLNSAGAAVEGGGEDFDLESSSKELPPDDLARTAVRNSTESLDSRVLTQTGILVQVPDGTGGWRTVHHEYPREQFAESVIDSIGAGSIRLIPLAAHRIRLLGRVDRVPLDSLSAHFLVPVRANHSRLGDVQAAVATAGGATTSLVPGDTLNLAFTATSVPAGKVRDFFVVTQGAYTTIGTQGASGLVQAAGGFKFALGAARPNPAVGRVTFSYSLGSPANAVLSLYSVSGRLIRTVVNGGQAAGPHEVVWNGTDDHGQRVHAGVFFYRLRAGSWSSEKKLVVIQP